MQPLEVADGLLMEGVLGELVALGVGEGVAEEEGFGLTVGEEVVVVLNFGGVEGGPLAGDVEVNFLEFEVVLLNGGMGYEAAVDVPQLEIEPFRELGALLLVQGPRAVKFPLEVAVESQLHRSMNRKKSTHSHIIHIFIFHASTPDHLMPSRYRLRPQGNSQDLDHPRRPSQKRRGTSQGLRQCPLPH